MLYANRMIITTVLMLVVTAMMPWAMVDASETQSSLEDTFQKAKQDYLDKNLNTAALQIKKGAAFLKEETARASDSGKAGLAASAKELEELADDVKKGTVKSVKKIEDTFARAYLALAKDAHSKSSRSWAEKQAQKAGEGLEKAGAYLERSFSWAGQKVETGTKETMQKSKDLSLNLKEKGRVVAEEVGKGLKETGNEIEKFGKKISPN